MISSVKPIRVFIADRSHAALIEQLSLVAGAFLHLVGGAELPSGPLDAEVLITEKRFPTPDTARRLRWIQLLSAGTDHVPAVVLQNPAWSVTHSGGASVVPIAEWCIAMMLFFAHRLRTIQQYQCERLWFKDRVSELTGHVLRGRTVGIIGYGALGREVARLCKAFGMTVHASLGRLGRQQALTYCTPGTGDPSGELPDGWFPLTNLSEVLPRMDFVVLGLRLSPETHHIIDRQVLDRFNPHAVLLNPSRGGLVDEHALINALHEKLIAGAALDVFETEPLPSHHPLRDAPNVLISPHCSPESVFYRGEVVRLILENCRRYALGMPLLNEVCRP